MKFEKKCECGEKVFWREKWGRGEVLGGNEKNAKNVNAAKKSFRREGEGKIKKVGAAIKSFRGVREEKSDVR